MPRARLARRAAAATLVMVVLLDAQLWVYATGHRAQGAARAPYEWAGTCPGECCRYNVEWVATAETRAWAEPRVPPSRAAEERPVFTIQPGDVVRALTGNLYSLESGVAQMRDDFSTDATYRDFSERHRQTITLDAGDAATLLAHIRGDTYRIVHDGGVVDANLHGVGAAEACAQRERPCAGIITRMPVTRWWVMVMNQHEQAGWVEEPRERFRLPACDNRENGSGISMIQLDGEPSFCTAVSGEWRSYTSPRRSKR